jgi:hypothetical protein
MKTHLGEIIYRLAEQQGIGIRELSKKVSNTTPSSFSKIRAGHYSRISNERLQEIATTLAPNDKATQALIICAYLQDMCPRSYRHIVDIAPKQVSQHCSNSSLNEQLDLIAEAAAVDDAFHAHLESLSHLASAILSKEHKS